jgi:hypothetical protein
MKAILEFNLPEDKEEHILAMQGAALKFAVQDYDNYLRGKIKYASDDVPEVVLAALQEARDRLYEILGEDGIEL